MRIIQYPKADLFVTIRQSLTDILNGNHLSAAILAAVIWASDAVTKRAGTEEIDTSQPGPWMWFADSDIERLMVPFGGKSLYASKAIHKAVEYLVAKGYIETRFDPVEKLNRRRQARLSRPARLQQELNDWAKQHPRMDFGGGDLALPFSRQYDGDMPRKPDPPSQKTSWADLEKEYMEKVKKQ